MRVLITGASRGLGAAAAAALSNVNSLVLVARSGEELRKVWATCWRAENHTAIPCDLLDMVQLQQMVRTAQDFLGGIDCVLHCAGGGYGFHDPLIADADLNKLFRLNVGAAAAINRMVVPEMKERGAGNLVHVASIASTDAVGSVGYNVSRAAMAAYVRSLGRAVAEFGIVATGIMPGAFTAPGNSMDRLQEKSPAAYQEFLDKRLPRKVMGRAEEIVPLLGFLCSPAASMMGGCMVPIDAGEGVTYV